MIQYKVDDIINAKEGLILHQVNCLGIMGGGVAKTLRDKFPEIYEEYRKFCSSSRSKEDLLGKVLFVPILNSSDKKIVGNIFAQVSIRQSALDKEVYTDYEALKEAFKFIRENYQGSSIAVPYLMGCGLANGDWGIVSNIIEEELSGGFDVVIYDKFNQRRKTNEFF